MDVDDKYLDDESFDLYMAKLNESHSTSSYCMRKSSHMEPGEHVCNLFDSFDASIIFPFVLEGLKNQQKVVYLFEEQDPNEIRQLLEENGINVQEHIDSGQLLIANARQCYCPDGLWDEQRVVTFIRNQTNLALEQGYSAARITADMTWTSGFLNCDQLLQYEATVNEVFCLPLIGLCQYDRKKFQPHTLMNILQAHPLTLVGKELYDNFYYVPPSALLGNDYDKQLNQQLRNLQNRKLIEKRLRRTFNDLNFVNQRLTDAIDHKTRTEKMLISMKEQAENEARSKSVFLAEMAHEIRTPMNGILATAELLSSMNLNTGHKECVDIILNSSQDLLLIVNTLLDLAKGTEGKMKMDCKAFDLRSSIVQVMNLQRNVAQKKGVAFTHNVDQDVPKIINGDSLRLRQILQNLISNSLKFTKAGEVSISVHVQDKTPSPSSSSEKLKNVTLRFDVRDTGCGIPHDKFDKVFEKYEQADDTVTAMYGGTGLGLSICKLFVELMGGKIWIDPENTAVGQGTTFSFTICCEAIEDNHPDPIIPIDSDTNMSPSSSSLSPSAISSATPAVETFDLEKLLPVPPTEVEILVVDDNKVNTIVCSRLLVQLGFKAPSIATSGEEAHRMAIIHHYDVVLMDFNMPVMNGQQTIEAIKKDLGNEPPPAFIYQTASDRDIRDDLTDPSIQWLQKPLSKAKLMHEIVRALRVSPALLSRIFERSPLRKRSRGEL
eukprot:TRINITY_DN369_c0_g1_i1.p1 TRINITY_DN369_c0_g1~~TRINITY_DN369_c0_g1_i1.p1  ORF type:complete len:719 (-),score=355.14 TRINITY_DN369_c0_g1_i1:164-2320(-)